MGSSTNHKLCGNSVPPDNVSKRGKGVSGEGMTVGEGNGGRGRGGGGEGEKESEGGRMNGKKWW